MFLHALPKTPLATKSSYQEPTMQRCQHKQIVAASKEYFGPKTWRSKKGENVLKKWEWRCWAESCFDKSVVVTWTHITQGVLPCLIFVLVQDRYKVRVKICTQWTSQRLMSCWLCPHFLKSAQTLLTDNYMDFSNFQRHQHQEERYLEEAGFFIYEWKMHFIKDLESWFSTSSHETCEGRQCVSGSVIL